MEDIEEWVGLATTISLLYLHTAMVAMDTEGWGDWAGLEEWAWGWAITIMVEWVWAWGTMEAEGIIITDYSITLMTTIFTNAV
jgi:hypothetical protein